MRNITVSVDDEIHRLARIRAAERDTSLSALVREFLARLVFDDLKSEAGRQVEESDLERCRSRMNEVIEAITANGGGLRMADNLPREALYDRAKPGRSSTPPPAPSTAKSCIQKT